MAAVSSGGISRVEQLRGVLLEEGVIDVGYAELFAHQQRRHRQGQRRHQISRVAGCEQVVDQAVDDLLDSRAQRVHAPERELAEHGAASRPMLLRVHPEHRAHGSLSFPRDNRGKPGFARSEEKRGSLSTVRTSS